LYYILSLVNLLGHGRVSQALLFMPSGTKLTGGYRANVAFSWSLNFLHVSFAIQKQLCLWHDSILAVFHPSSCLQRKNGFVFSNEIGLSLRVGWSQIVTFLGECTLFILAIWTIKVSDDSIIK
jgi:hypothetical protein